MSGLAEAPVAPFGGLHAAWGTLIAMVGALTAEATAGAPGGTHARFESVLLSAEALVAEVRHALEGSEGHDVIQVTCSPPAPVVVLLVRWWPPPIAGRVGRGLPHPRAGIGDR